MSVEALKRAIVQSGGQAKFGRLVGKSQQLVSYWLTSERGLPPELVLHVESSTGVPRWELRPDIYPPDLPASPLAAQAA